MVSSYGAASNAQNYLRSLLPQQQPTEARASGGGDSLQALLAAFYPAGASSQSSSNDGAAAGFSEPQSSSGPCVACSPNTMASLIALQGQQQSQRPSRAERAEALFGKMDADRDGSVTKSEFEAIFGSNADMTKVDGLLTALDSNGDGAMSKDELVAAAQASRGARHHYMRGIGQGGLAELLASRNLNGATSESASNADGSTTTTISYADGTKIAMTVPGSQAAGTENQGGTDTGAGNLLQRLFRMQAEFLAQSSKSLAATTSVTA